MSKRISISNYCLCSEASFGEIVKLQEEKPLRFEEFVEQYTRCNDGCGGCTSKLEILLGELGLLVDRT